MTREPLTKDMVLEWMRSHREPKSTRETAMHFDCEQQAALIVLRRLNVSGALERVDTPKGRAYRAPANVAADIDDDLGDNDGFPVISPDEVVRSALANRDPVYLAWWGRP